MTSSPEVPVLIVGGSLNGLSIALFLASQGIRCTLVERHPVTTLQYKFSGISPRSMEIYRSVGIEDEIRARRAMGGTGRGIARARNLTDPDVQWGGPAWPDLSDLSATPAAFCDQDQLEPLLRAHAERLGADLRFDSELVQLEQDAGGVRARVRGRGGERELCAQFLVAADGTHGEIRERLGIRRAGPGPLQHWMNLIFETDLQPELQGRPFTSVFITELNASLVAREEKGRWLLALQYFPAKGERPQDFGAARCRELVRRAAGRADVRVELVDARPWEVAACVAERFREGRVFLVGDTAHAIPPTGGFAGNTGIQDGHNLAWKLAHVLHGAAGPALLESYDAERRPVAERTLGQALARLAAWFRDPEQKLAPAEPIAADEAVIFGHRYLRGALCGDPGPGEPFFENPREPGAWPGSRAPHFAVQRDGAATPIHDLFGPGFTLLAARRGEPWLEAGRTLQLPGATPLRAYLVDPGGELRDPAGRFSKLYQLGEGGAVLVRPDGFIAWRADAPSATPVRALREALESLGLRAG